MATSSYARARPASSSPLPSTRLTRPRRAAGGWLTGALVGVGANLLLVVALVWVTRLHPHPGIDPPLAMRLQRVDPPPPDDLDDEPVSEPADAAPEDPPPAVSLPLPALDLATAGEAPVTLPALPPTDDLIQLPTSIPAFTSAAPVVAGPLAVPVAAPGDFDEPARVAAAFDLERFYPRAAKLRRIEGRSVVRLAIAADGAVTSCTLVSSTPPGVFDQAVERLARTLRFQPAKRGGKAVASTLTQHIVWTLKK